MPKANKKPVIQLITREKDTESFGFSFGTGLKDLIKNNPIPELYEGKDGYLKISPTDKRIFFDSLLEPKSDFTIYKITHLKENDHAYRNFIKYDKDKIFKFIEENNVSIMNFPIIEEICRSIGYKVMDFFKMKNFQKFQDWRFEKLVFGKSNGWVNKISKFTGEIFSFWQKESPKITDENSSKVKTLEIPTAFLTRPFEHLGTAEWALTLYSYTYLKDSYEIVYAQKKYDIFYKKIISFIEKSIDSIEINGQKGVRVYGHNGLYFYQFYQDALSGDFCKKCDRFLETELTPNELIRENRRTLCTESDNIDCYRNRKTEGQKRYADKK